MKSCDNCRHIYNAGGEYSCYVCELFGEDIPYEFEKEDGCCLHPNEVKKAIRLKDCALSWEFMGYGKELNAQEKRLQRKVCEDFNKYMKHLKEKYAEGNK